MTTGKLSKTVTADPLQINTIAGKNDSLFSRIDVLQGKMDELNRKIARSEREVETLNKNIAGLNNDLKQKETLIKEFNDSLVTIYKNDSISKLPVFVTAADLTGGYGLKVKTAPYSKDFFGGTVLIGMEFHKRFLAGLGTGIEAFNGGTLLPVFAEFRYGPGDRKNMPYLFTKGGAMVNLDDNDLSNVFLNSGLGISHPFSEKLTLNFSVGFFAHTAVISNHDSFINLNLGIKYTKNKKPIK